MKKCKKLDKNFKVFRKNDDKENVIDIQEKIIKQLPERICICRQSVL